MRRLTADLRALRSVLVLAFILPAVLASSLPPAAAGLRHAGTPEPAAMRAPTSQAAQGGAQAATLGAATVRVHGTQRVFQINASGRIVRMRRVDFGYSTVLAGTESVHTFAGAPYTRLASGHFGGWWVAAPHFSLHNVQTFSTPREVRLSAGGHLGSRFFADGTVRTRRALHLPQAATYSVGKKGTFGDRTFLYLTDGPLANRWVMENRRHVLVGQGSAADTPEPTDPATAATWKVAVLIYRETDVTFTRSNGSDYRLRARMSSNMYDLVLDTLGRFRRSVRSWSGGLAGLDMDVVDVPHPITRLNQLSGGYWVGPDAVEEDLDRYAPSAHRYANSGTYDSIVVIWQSKDDSGVQVPVAGWGLTLAPGWWANGAGYSSVIVPTQNWWWTDAVHPEEVFVHEWMHQVIYFHERAGRMELDLHAGPKFGYQDRNGTWKEWLSDVMQGRVRDGDRFRGVSPEIWASGIPRNP